MQLHSATTMLNARQEDLFEAIKLATSAMYQIADGEMEKGDDCSPRWQLAHTILDQQYDMIRELEQSVKPAKKGDTNND